MISDNTTECPFATTLARHVRAAREELTARWLERIGARVSIEPEHIFPSDPLLGHVHVLMDGIADYIEDPTDEITADVPVIAKAMQIGELRLQQGFDASEILKEYEILGGLLFHFAANVIRETGERCEPDELLACGHRLFRAVSVISQATTTQYLLVLGERVGEREERLRRFSRMITHELKNRVGAVIGAGQLLQESWVDQQERERFASMVLDNAQGIQKVLENLSALTRLDGDRRRQKNIRLPEAVQEVFRQLRDLARARDVQMRRSSDLPEVEVNAAAVELCLSNYLSNAIKYSDPRKHERWTAVEARVEEGGEQAEENGEQAEERGATSDLVVRVRDNGLGVPADKRDGLFQRFFRAHEAETSVEGTGLGLNLVQETVEALGGRAWVEFEGEGSTFAFALPCRRVSPTPAQPAPRDVAANAPQSTS
jgi:signal transduction histidine kinase